MVVVIIAPFISAASEVDLPFIVAGILDCIIKWLVPVYWWLCLYFYMNPVQSVLNSCYYCRVNLYTLKGVGSHTFCSLPWQSWPLLLWHSNHLLCYCNHMLLSSLYVTWPIQAFLLSFKSFLHQPMTAIHACINQWQLYHTSLWLYQPMTTIQYLPLVVSITSLGIITPQTEHIVIS